MKKYFTINNGLKIYKSFKLAHFTTFKIGGRAEFFCIPRSANDIKSAIKFAEEKNLKKFILGGGSNVLISDKGLNGLVISVNKLNKIWIDRNFLITEAGAEIDKVSYYALKKSLSGLEFAGGLPGSIGGAVYMNAKAYGSSMSEIVHSVTVIDKKGKIIKLKNKDIGFSYKNSIFMNNGDLFIYSIELKLSKGDKKKIKELYNKNKNDRKLKGQYDFPSAGCIFKNDYELNLVIGRLIEEMGLKGTRIGDAMISYKHANFIINKGHAKTEDVKRLIELVEKKVFEEKGIKLHREIRLLGF